MLKDLCEATGQHESPDSASYERVHVPFNRKISLSAISHALGVRHESPSTNDRNFSPPDDLCDREDGAVNFGLGVPVAGNQKHICAGVNARFVDSTGCRSPIVFALHVHEADVCGGLIYRDIRVESDYLSTRPQRAEVVALNGGSGLILCESRDGERKRLGYVQLAREAVSGPRA